MTRAELRKKIMLHNSPRFRGITGRVAADLINYTACQIGRKERAVAREITSVVVMDCYGEIVVYVDLNGGDFHGGETVEAHYLESELMKGEVCAKSYVPPAVYMGEWKAAQVGVGPGNNDEADDILRSAFDDAEKAVRAVNAAMPNIVDAAFVDLSRGELE